MVVKLSSSMNTPGHYVGRSTCAESGRYRCEDESHYHTLSMIMDIIDTEVGDIYSYQLGERQHMNVIVYYHVPHLGIMTIRACSEQEANHQARVKISAALSQLYLLETKKLMELEQLMNKEIVC